MAQKKPPDQVRRRNTTLITNLPPDGRKGAPPKWPLSKPTAGETKRWQELWKMPQAEIWERWHLERVVARYVRVAEYAEMRNAPATVLAEARRFEVELGMTPKAIMSLQWTLGETKSETKPKAVQDQLAKLRAEKAAS